jgi:hypothetical protein
MRDKNTRRLEFLSTGHARMKRCAFVTRRRMAEGLRVTDTHAAYGLRVECVTGDL